MPPQDFYGQNLQGRSFSGLDLSGVDFGYTDIRGADFSQAILRGANFSHAQAGLQRSWANSLVVASWLLSAISGLFSGLTGYLITVAFDKTKPDFSAGVVSLIMLVVLFMIIIRHGLGTVAFCFAVTIAVVFDLAIVFNFAVAVTVAATFTVTVAAIGAFVVAVAIAGATVVAGVAAGAVAVAVVATVTVAVATIIGVVAVAVSSAIALLGAYMGWRAVNRDEKYTLIQRVITFAARGTSFRSADLTDANFTSATLKNTDFRNAILIRTCWYQVK